MAAGVDLPEGHFQEFKSGKVWAEQTVQGAELPWLKIPEGGQEALPSFRVGLMTTTVRGIWQVLVLGLEWGGL